MARRFRFVNPLSRRRSSASHSTAHPTGSPQPIFQTGGYTRDPAVLSASVTPPPCNTPTMYREQEFHFIYEHGVLRPEGWLVLPEGARGIAHIR